MAHGLSKTKLLAYLQCRKRLWLEVHRPELAELDPAAIGFRHGHGVGEAARSLHPGGILVETDDPAQALVETRRLIAGHPAKPLFEAAFEHAGVLIRTDLLVPDGNGYRMVEVKASARVKDYHYSDCAVQAWVCRQAGLPLGRVELAHVDTGFVYPGGGDYRGLLKTVDLTGAIEAVVGQVPDWIGAARATLAGSEPDITPGEQCSVPYECPFMAYCAKAAGLPAETGFPLRILPRAGKLRAALEAESYRDLREVPPGRLTKPIHQRVQRVALTGEAELDPAAAEVLRRLSYPRHFVDFESIQFAVPCWPGTRLYQQIVFQWSCHIEDAPGELRHHEFLGDDGDDPRRAFAEALIAALGASGPVFVYNIAFERTCIARLAESFPGLSTPLLAIGARMVDLLPIARGHYYHPAMDGSWSIKAVLPTVAPELDYESLQVQHGAMAQEAYAELITPGTAPERRAELRQGLLEYCKLDTLALARLAWYLEGRPAEIETQS